MDDFLDTEPAETTLLSYDDTIPYEEQVLAIPVDEPTTGTTSNSLAGRISANKVYVPPQGIFSSGKVRELGRRNIVCVSNIWSDSVRPSEEAGGG